MRVTISPKGEESGSKESAYKGRPYEAESDNESEEPANKRRRRYKSEDSDDDWGEWKAPNRPMKRGSSNDSADTDADAKVRLSR